jgi:small-conductance mechanosensitive channel
VRDVRGEISAIEPAATVIRTRDGDEVRVPNHLLVESLVRVHGRAGGDGDGPL